VKCSQNEQIMSIITCLNQGHGISAFLRQSIVSPRNIHYTMYDVTMITTANSSDVGCR